MKYLFICALFFFGCISDPVQNGLDYHGVMRYGSLSKKATFHVNGNSGTFYTDSSFRENGISIKYGGSFSCTENSNGFAGYIFWEMRDTLKQETTKQEVFGYSLNPQKDTAKINYIQPNGTITYVTFTQ